MTTSLLPTTEPERATMEDIWHAVIIPALLDGLPVPAAVRLMPSVVAGPFVVLAEFPTAQDAAKWADRLRLGEPRPERKGLGQPTTSWEARRDEDGWYWRIFGYGLLDGAA